jgi:sugar phosphate isomerase/epimerase
MKLGLFTAPFPRRSLEQVASWAAGEGFELLEVASWPAAGAERRHYAGTSHIDVTSVDPEGLHELLETCRRSVPRASRRRRPGGTNLAATPAAWDEMFSIVDSESFGLNLDPSHLIWLMIDAERVVRDYAGKLFHVHAKDLRDRPRRPLPHWDALAGDGVAGAASPRAR